MMRSSGLEVYTWIFCVQWYLSSTLVRLPVYRQDGFVVQTGDPEGPDEGFRDPKTGEIRT
jgi:hypothetical protein